MSSSPFLDNQRRHYPKMACLLHQEKLKKYPYIWTKNIRKLLVEPCQRKEIICINCGTVVRTFIDMQEKIETIIPDDVDQNDKKNVNSIQKDVVRNNNENSEEIEKIDEEPENEGINNSENNNFDEVELID